ncbi:MAG: hypothetical protein KJP21_07070, partial [Bacteroidia bacterium]|nr:hypothetical protein [Bacteroidia bacterium]
MIKFKLLFLFLFGLLLIAGCKEDDPEAENLAPTTFDLLYVADRESDVTLTPMLTWEQSSSSLNPVRYSLLMDKKQDLEDQGLTEPVTEVAKGLENNYFQFENYLDVITEYHWYVVASDADGNTTRSSSTYTFVTTIDTLDPPDSFKLLLPIDGFIDAPLKPSLSWEKATDPNNIPVIYDVYFGKNANPTSLYQQYVIGTSITIPTDLDFETTYFWKVVAKNIKGATTASTTFSFTTRPDLNNIITSATKKTSSGLDSLYGGIYGHQVVEFNGSLYMLGGNDLGNSNAVFKSTDGWNWDLIKPHNSDEPFFPSDELQAVVFKNQIWVFDGTRNTIRNSSDGIIWNNVTVSGSVIDGSHWKGKHGHQVVVFDGRIFVIGGTNAGIPTNDVWSSDNGVDWEYDTNQDYIFPRRIGHACVVHKGRMYVVGGSSDGVLQN